MPITINPDTLRVRNSAGTYVSIPGIIKEQEESQGSSVSGNKKNKLLKFQHGNAANGSVEVGTILEIDNNIKAMAYATIPYRQYTTLINHKDKNNNYYAFRFYIVNSNNQVINGQFNWQSYPMVQIDQPDTGQLTLYVIIRVLPASKLQYITIEDINFDAFYMQTEIKKSDVFNGIKYKTQNTLSHTDFISNYMRLPLIEITNDNVLLCTSEIRYGTYPQQQPQQDFQGIASDLWIADIGIARSFDYGKTFIDKKIILYHNINQENKQSRCRGGILLCDRKTNIVYLFCARINSTAGISAINDQPNGWPVDLIYKYSRDNGETWSQQLELNITNYNETKLRLGIHALLFGISKGITMTDTNQTLVVPMRYYNNEQGSQQKGAILLYSSNRDSSGLITSWYLSKSSREEEHDVGKTADENSIIEYINNNQHNIALFSRHNQERNTFFIHNLNPDSNGKWNETWTWAKYSKAYPNPNPQFKAPQYDAIGGCESDLDKIIMFDKTLYLFSGQNNLNSTTEERNSLKLHMSFNLKDWEKIDEDKQPQLSLEQGINFGYSNMTIKNGYIYYVYEDYGDIKFIYYPICSLISPTEIFNTTFNTNN